MALPRWTGLGLAGAAGLLAYSRRPGASLGGKVALVTGSSRGLGLAIARELADQGARVALCARNSGQLNEAVDELREGGAEAIGVPCDVTRPEEVRRLVDTARNRLGPIDVLVANAGTITVGPLDAQTLEDFQHSMDVMFWGVYHAVMAVLPEMRERGDGRIVTIGSIGGKIPVPHLVPYSVAKFAAVGFSEGLRAELAPAGIKVTTVIPGLMRTGSHINALTKGRHRDEYRWFGTLAVLPVSSISAGHAARRIVAATRRGDAEVMLSWQTHLAVRLHGLAPGLVSRLAGVAGRLLPGPGDDDPRRPRIAHETGEPPGPAPVTKLSERAAKRHNQ